MKKKVIIGKKRTIKERQTEIAAAVVYPETSIVQIPH